MKSQISVWNNSRMCMNLVIGHWVEHLVKCQLKQISCVARRQHPKRKKVGWMDGWIQTVRQTDRQTDRKLDESDWYLNSSIMWQTWFFYSSLATLPSGNKDSSGSTPDWEECSSHSQWAQRATNSLAAKRQRHSWWELLVSQCVRGLVGIFLRFRHKDCFL